jgi:hypothetical protein
LPAFAATQPNASTPAARLGSNISHQTREAFVLVILVMAME